MIRVAYLFPGQGSQAIGMGLDLFDHSPVARRVFEEVDDTLGQSLTTCMFEGPIEELTRTENAQLAIVTVSIAAHSALQKTGKAPVPVMVAGHSLGEYSALAVAGVLSIPDTIRLVMARGQLMQHACDERPGGMAALLSIDELAVEEICRETGTSIANINTDKQIIISGDHMSLARAIDLASARGAKRCIPLPVGGAFHSGLMESARSGLIEMINSLDWHDPTIPIIANCDARPLTRAWEIKTELALQIVSCVLWSASIEYMISKGVFRFIEVGQGKVLAGMMKHINENVTVSNVSDMESVLALTG